MASASQRCLTPHPLAPAQSMAPRQCAVRAPGRPRSTRTGVWCAGPTMVPPGSISKLLESQPSLASADAVPAALHTTIVECDRQLMEGDLQGVARTAGTTSTVCYLRGNEIWVACSGDSRAVLCSLPGDHIAATDMSKDFKPELPEERARIEALGGEVTVSGPRGLPPAPWRSQRTRRPCCPLASCCSIGSRTHRSSRSCRASVWWARPITRRPPLRASPSSWNRPPPASAMPSCHRPLSRSNLAPLRSR